MTHRPPGNSEADQLPVQGSPTANLRPTDTGTAATSPCPSLFDARALQARSASVNLTNGTKRRFLFGEDQPHEIHLEPRTSVCLHLRANRPPFSLPDRSSVPCGHRSGTVSPSAAPTPSPLSRLRPSRPRTAFPVHRSVSGGEESPPGRFTNPTWAMSLRPSPPSRFSAIAAGSSVAIAAWASQASRS